VNEEAIARAGLQSQWGHPQVELTFFEQGKQNVSVLPEDNPLRAEKCRGVTV
jgi:hypothetical protein